MAGAFLVYDITERKTFQHLKLWLDEIKKGSNNSNIEIVLIGNKKDLEERRKVTSEEDKAFTQEYGLVFLKTIAPRLQSILVIFFLKPLRRS